MIEKEEKVGRAVVTDTTFNGGTDIFMDVMVPRHCPLVFLVKVC
jgi:hypothetical protein